MAGDDAAVSRWHIWLPAVAAVASAGMIFLAATATRALDERQELALDGRVLGVAHGVELGLRDEGMAAAQEILQRQVADSSGDLTGLTLLSPGGDVQASAGEHARGAVTREVDLFVGGGGRRGRGRRGPDFDPRRDRRSGGGRAILRVDLAAAAVATPVAARLLLPVTAAFALALFALALFGARLLRRQGREAQLTAARRRLEALGRAGAGLAHQLRTPLATIKGASQLMVEEADGEARNPEATEQLRGRLETVLTQVERMQLMVSRLLDYARPPRPEPRTLAVAETAREVAANAAVPPDLQVRADPEHLREILEILVDNARKASPPGAAIEVAGDTRGEHALIFVRDEGGGPGSDPEHLFEPYVSGRADGTGLGLPIARTLAEANHGSLVLAERETGGCEATLTLPRNKRE